MIEGLRRLPDRDADQQAVEAAGVGVRLPRDAADDQGARGGPRLRLPGRDQGLWTTGPSLVRYWRSFEDLERYARDPDAEHLPAWREFNQRVRASGDVGIWHETYRVRAGEYEAIYGNMPRVGLAAAGELIPVGSMNDTAALRIGAREDDRAPVAY